MDGIANFRDIGGYPISSSSSSPNTTTRSIRRNLLYRAADPSLITPTGLETLKSLNVTHVFDLRSEPEIQRKGPEFASVPISAPFTTIPAPTPSPASGGTSNSSGEISRVWTPVFAVEDYSPEQIALRYKAYASQGSAGFVEAYRTILLHAGPAYSTILTYLASEDPRPCVVHCTAGKDRTGVLVALIYLILGVDNEVVAKEYGLTDQGLAALKPLFKERLLKNPALAGNESGVANMIATRPENMSATIEMIKETYGSAEAYVREVVGLSEEQLERLRENFTSEVRAVL